MELNCFYHGSAVRGGLSTRLRWVYLPQFLPFHCQQWLVGKARARQMSRFWAGRGLFLGTHLNLVIHFRTHVSLAAIPGSVLQNLQAPMCGEFPVLSSQFLSWATVLCSLLLGQIFQVTLFGIRREKLGLVSVSERLSLT